MTTINFPKFVRSLRHAGHGLWHALTTENNFRIQAVLAAAVLILTIVLKIPRSEAVAIVLVVSSVLVLELVNTIVERLADLLEPRIHPYVHIIKDLMAASVVVAASAAIAVGLMVFWPYLVKLFGA